MPRPRIHPSRPMTPAERQQRRRALLRDQQEQKGKVFFQELEAKHPGSVFFGPNGEIMGLNMKVKVADPDEEFDAEVAQAERDYAEMEAEAKADRRAWYRLGLGLRAMRAAHKTEADFLQEAEREFPGITPAKIAGALWFAEHALDLRIDVLDDDDDHDSHDS
jgi:hypothetical protein